jgi:class 3 adenylate cyclase
MKESLHIFAIVFLLGLNLLSWLFFALRFSRIKKTAESEKNNAKKCSEEAKDLEEKTFAIAEANVKLLEKNEEREEQKMKLAEANLKLLEQSEQLEEQKMKLAEANLKLLEYNEIIEKERAVSEKLLLNILPLKVANELKNHGKTEPESFENVTVMFSDIVEFTKLASSLDPKILIDELNNIFTGFDKIVRKNHCERIKTIGDAYLCVCGMPAPNPRHAENIIRAGLEIIEFLNERNKKSELQWHIRAGVHSGRVVGGVVGIEKYIYDVFGDTINTASRMESNSESMKLNISESAYQFVSDKFKFVERGSMEVKGKGGFKMYFVQGE